MDKFQGKLDENRDLFGVDEIADVTHNVGSFLLDDTDEEVADGKAEEQQPRPPTVLDERSLTVLGAGRTTEPRPYVEGAEHQLEDMGEYTITIHVEQEVRVSVGVDLKLDLANFAVE